MKFYTCSIISTKLSNLVSIPEVLSKSSIIKFKYGLSIFLITNSVTKLSIQQGKEDKNNNLWLYVTIGGSVTLNLVLIILLILKSKKNKTNNPT